MTTHFLPADTQLTVTPAALSTGLLVRLSDQPGGEPYAPVALAASTPVTVGPFATPRRYDVVTYTGSIAVAFSEVSEVAQDTVAITGGTISGVTFEIGDATDVLLLSGDGVPEDAVQASLSRNPAGDDNALTFTAVAYGAAGNSITITYVDPAANDAALSVVVAGSAVTVNLATGGGGAIESTAADILTEWEATPAADALATVAIDTTDSGVADDGSGVVTALASAPFTGGEGAGIGTAGIGSLYADYTNGKLYINGGTLAVPAWKIVTSAA